MSYLEWVLLAATVIIAVIDIYYGLRLAMYGATYLSNPTWWLLGPWNLIGVSLILILHRTPWHLLWWWCVGTLLAGLAKALIWQRQR